MDELEELDSLLEQVFKEQELHLGFNAQFITFNEKIIGAKEIKIKDSDFIELLEKQYGVTAEQLEEIFKPAERAFEHCLGELQKVCLGKEDSQNAN